MSLAPQLHSAIIAMMPSESDQGAHKKLLVKTNTVRKSIERIERANYNAITKYYGQVN